MSTRDRIGLLFVTAAAASVALTGCTSATVNTGPTPTPSEAAPATLSSTNVAIAEYDSTVASFAYPMPKGVKFPAPPAALAQGQSLPGVGAGPVYAFWLCAWEQAYLNANAKSDASAESTALAQIALYPTTAWAKQYFNDPGNGWVNAVVVPARAGDPSGVRSDFKSETCAAVLPPSK